MTFKFAHMDQWSRRFVYCPVPECGLPYEEDTMLRHITKQAKGDHCAPDKAHADWLAQNTYTHPTE